MSKLVIVIGQSGSGKTTVTSTLAENGMFWALENTSREQRYKGESGYGVFGLSLEDYNGEVLSHTVFTVADGNTQEYFLPKKALDDALERGDTITVSNPTALPALMDNLKKHYGDSLDISVVVLEAPEHYLEWRVQLSDREEFEKAEQKRRLEADAKDMKALTEYMQEFKIPHAKVKNVLDPEVTAMAVMNILYPVNRELRDVELPLKDGTTIRVKLGKDGRLKGTGQPLLELLPKVDISGIETKEKVALLLSAISTSSQVAPKHPSVDR